MDRFLYRESRYGSGSNDTVSNGLLKGLEELEAPLRPRESSCSCLVIEP